MTEPVTFYPTIAMAEKAIIDAGYVRKSQRSIWVSSEGKTAKVVRDVNGKFHVQWS